VSGLTTPLAMCFISTDASNASPLYYDTVLKVWSKSGLIKTTVTVTKVCFTSTHLTSFAGFSTGGSAAGDNTVVIIIVVVIVCGVGLLVAAGLIAYHVHNKNKAAESS